MKQAREAMPRITVIIPAYNEAHRILPTLSSVTDFLDARFTSWNVLIVDDGSTDKTAEVVSTFARVHPRVMLYRLAKNTGKGAAVRLGVSRAAGRLILYMDADGAIPIGELDKLLPQVEEGIPIVVGSKSFPGKGLGHDFKWYRLVMGRVFNFFVRLFLIRGIHDSQCGFKLMEHDAAKAIFELQTRNGFSFDLEVLYLAKLLGIAFREVPVRWSNVEGSRIHLVRDSITMFADIFKIRFQHSAKSVVNPCRKGETF